MFMARRGKAWCGMAWQGMARRGMARLGKAGQGINEYEGVKNEKNRGW